MGIPFQSTHDVTYFITTSIYDEIKHIKKNISGLELLLSAKRVSIIDPSPKFIASVKKKTVEMNALELSEADLTIIALGIEMEYPILSTDYILVNLAKHLHLQVVVPGKGKFKVKTLRKYCSLCKSFVNTSAPYCEFCGNMLIFKKV